MLETIDSFYEKDSFFKKIYESYKEKTNDHYEKAVKNTVRKEYAGGGENLHRGFYCPSPVLDIIVGGCKRGKLIKAPRRQPDYEYSFDEKDRLIMVKQLCTENTEIPPAIELIFYDTDTVNSILLQKSDISFLTRCIYENGLIKQYDFAQIPGLPDKNKNSLRETRDMILSEDSVQTKNTGYSAFCSEIKTENFEYKGKDLVSSTLETYNFDVDILSQHKYLYNYDDDGKMVSYTSEEYDNGERIASLYDNHLFEI